MNKHNYSVNDLIHDQSFHGMVKGRASQEEIERWSAWMEDSEQNRRTAQEAIAEISGFQFDDPASIDFDKEWSKLYKSTVGRQNFYKASSAKKDFGLRMVYQLTAAVLLVGLVGLEVFFYAGSQPAEPQLEQITQEETVHTSDGQQKTLNFTNNGKTAKVVLNENSTLIYEVGLLQDQPIEISLQGEAFFDVEQGFSEGHPAFSISTPDGLIKDLGTEFLVTVEKDRSRVVLQEGIVKIQQAARDQTQEEFEITKGQMVEFSKADILQLKIVNSSFYTSWATGSMQFGSTKVSDFAEYVRHRFEVEVILKDHSLKEVTLEGAVYFKSLEGLLRSVSEITKIPIYQSQHRDTVYIGNMYNANQKHF